MSKGVKSNRYFKNDITCNWFG